jgi:hypothetical protein
MCICIQTIYIYIYIYIYLSCVTFRAFLFVTAAKPLIFNVSGHAASVYILRVLAWTADWIK